MLKIMKENKKKAISLIIGLLLIFGGIVYIAVSNSETKKDNNIKVSANSIKELRKDKQDAKVELEKAKESGNKAEIAKAEKKLESIEKKEAKIVSNTGSTVKSGNTGNTTKPSVKPVTKPSAPSTPSTPKPKEKQRVWIVDKAAWTETVTKTRTETKYRPTWWGRLRDGSIKTFYSEEEVYNAYGNTVVAWGNGEDEAYTVQVPYTETINHPAQGHWEYR